MNDRVTQHPSWHAVTERLQNQNQHSAQGRAPQQPHARAPRTDMWPAVLPPPLFVAVPERLRACEKILSSQCSGLKRVCVYACWHTQAFTNAHTHTQLSVCSMCVSQSSVTGTSTSPVCDTGAEISSREEAASSANIC